MGLRDWDITIIANADLPDSCLARCRIALGRKAAEIMLGAEFDKESAEGKRATMVHELLHCHFSRADEVVDETLPDLLGDPVYKTFYTGFNLAMEVSIDAVAVEWAKSMPLPPEGE